MQSLLLLNQKRKKVNGIQSPPRQSLQASMLNGKFTHFTCLFYLFLARIISLFLGLLLVLFMFCRK